MKIIEQSARLVETDYLSAIEAAGRTCYQSMDKSLCTQKAATKFIQRLINSKHDAMIEFCTVTIKISSKLWYAVESESTREQLRYFIVDDWVGFDDIPILVSANMRAWRKLFLENEHIGGACSFIALSFIDRYPELFHDYPEERAKPSFVDIDRFAFSFPGEDEILSFPTRCDHLFRHFLLTTDRGVTHELVRHRPASFAQESTRYVNYDDTTIIKPVWWNKMNEEQKMIFVWAAMDCEKYYRFLIQSGQTPQQARAVLSNCLKADINIKTNLTHWKQIFELRCSSAAHPQIRELMFKVVRIMSTQFPIEFLPLQEELQKALKPGKVKRPAKSS